MTNTTILFGEIDEDWSLVQFLFTRNLIMKFKITEIELDFTDDLEDEALDKESQDEIYDDILNTIWDADNEDDLVEQITCAHGWCIKKIDYVYVFLDYRLIW